MQVREINVKFVFAVDDEITNEDIIYDIEDAMFRATQFFDEIGYLYSDNPDHMTVRDATEEEVEMIEEQNEWYEEEMENE